MRLFLIYSELEMPYSPVIQFESNFGSLFLVNEMSTAKFYFLYGNVNPVLERIRDEKNSSFVTHGTFPIPHSWLSSCDKIKIPHSRLRRSWGILISSRLLSHSWGIGNVPFVTHEEFFIPIFVASPLIQEKSHPYFSPDRV